MKNHLVVAAVIFFLLLAGCVKIPGVPANSQFSNISTSGPNGTSPADNSTFIQTPNISGGTLSITPQELPAWVSDEYGSADLLPMIGGGAPPYSCSLSAGSSLPEGLTLSPDCSIWGMHSLPPNTPQEISPPFTVEVSDSSQPPLSGTLPLTVSTVEAPPYPIVSSASCAIQSPCTAIIAEANGGTPPYHFSLGTMADGAPPPGVSLGLDGKLSGIPAAGGTYEFSVCVADSVGQSSCRPATVFVQNYPECYYPELGDEEKFPGEPRCCQHHSWCNGPGSCCNEEYECQC
ncbi:MAG: hypothetical protein V1728_02905 [Candidatus Micrarchaeota archaeon]